MGLIDEYIGRCDIEQRIHLKKIAVHTNSREMWEEFSFILRDIKHDIEKKRGFEMIENPKKKRRLIQNEMDERSF